MPLNNEERVKKRAELIGLARYFPFGLLNDEELEDPRKFTEFLSKFCNSEPKTSIVLDGVQYQVISRLGSGEEADVYKIYADGTPGKKLALKVYFTNDIGRINGDFIILQKASHARPYLNMPIIVNVELGYMISPALTPHHVTEERKLELQIRQLEAKIWPALANDGLTLGDNWNAGNYVSTADGSLLRIDFGAAKELKPRPTFRP